MDIVDLKLEELVELDTDELEKASGGYVNDRATCPHNGGFRFMFTPGGRKRFICELCGRTFSHRPIPDSDSDEE